MSHYHMFLTVFAVLFFIGFVPMLNKSMEHDQRVGRIKDYKAKKLEREIRRLRNRAV